MVQIWFDRSLQDVQRGHKVKWDAVQKNDVGRQHMIAVKPDHDPLPIAFQERDGAVIATSYVQPQLEHLYTYEDQVAHFYAMSRRDLRRRQRKFHNQARLRELGLWER